MSDVASFLSKVASEKAVTLQGQAGKEQTAEKNKGVAGVNPADTTQNPSGTIKDQHTNGNALLAADDAVKGVSVTRTETNTNKLKDVGPLTKAAAMHRMQNLQAGVLNKVNELAQAMQKTASVQDDSLSKEASAQYTDFLNSWYNGYNTANSDIAATQQTLEQAGLGKVAAADAAELVDAAAQEDPNLIAPVEEGVENATDAATGAGGELDQIAQILAENGVSEEQVMQAAQVIEALKQSGVSDEEIMTELTGLLQGEGVEKAANERGALVRQFLIQNIVPNK